MPVAETPSPIQPIKTLKLYPTCATSIQTSHSAFVFSCSKLDNRLSLYDINSGDKIINLDAPNEHPSQISVSSDGAKAAFGTSTGAVYIWDVMYPTSMESFRPEEDNPSSITCLSWHPRGPVLAVGTNTGNLHLWDMVVGTFLYTIPAHKGCISTISWTANGRMLVSAGLEDSAVRAWNPRNMDSLAQLSDDENGLGTTPASGDIQWHRNGIIAMDTLEDMSRVTLTGGGDGSVLLSVLKPETLCGVFHQMQAHKNASVSAVRLASIECPKPFRAASAAEDGSVHLFDMDRRLPMGKFIHREGKVKQLEFFDNADVLFSAAGDTVMAWDARVAPEEEAPITFSNNRMEVTQFAFTNGQNNLVCACSDGVLRCFDIRIPYTTLPDLLEET